VLLQETEPQQQQSIIQQPFLKSSMASHPRQVTRRPTGIAFTINHKKSNLTYDRH